MTTKQPISATLTADNATGPRSVSELLDQLVTGLERMGGSTVRSVVGTIEVDPADPLLETSDVPVPALFSIDRKLTGKRRADTREPSRVALPKILVSLR